MEMVSSSDSGRKEGGSMQDNRPGKQAAPRATPLPPDKDLPHQGLNTLACLLPPVGAGLYLSCRRTVPRRAASLARWSWAGMGFYAASYLTLAVVDWFLY